MWSILPGVCEKSRDGWSRRVGGKRGGGVGAWDEGDGFRETESYKSCPALQIDGISLAKIKESFV